MSGEKILACDLGTSQCKVSVFDADGRLVASAAEGYATVYGSGNEAEQDPEIWWSAFIRVMQQVITPGDRYVCLALTGQMSACLPVDRAGSPLRPAMIWADQRATVEAEIFERTIGRERLYAITGNPPSATYTGPKVLWMKRHEPDLFARAACFLQPKEFLAHRLTGAFVTDYSDASCTSLFDLQARVWDQPLLDELGLPREKLPEAVPSTEVIGQVSAEAASTTGIPAGTPVVIGGGDGPTAAVGAGVIEEGSAYISLGSSAWVSFCQPQPLYDPMQRTFNYCHLVPGMYALTGTMQSAGSSYAWCIDNLFANDKAVVETLGGDLDTLLNSQVAAIPPGAEKLLFLPYLIGERTPYWNPYASGAFIGLRPHHTRYHLVRAVMESIGLHLRLIQDVFAEQGVSSDEVIVIGGGSSNELLMRLCSDIFQKRLLHGMLTTGATSFGAAIAGAVGVGLLETFQAAKRWFSEPRIVVPDAAQADRYSVLYARFQKAYRLLEPLFCEE
jgi:xylulokinase